LKYQKAYHVEPIVDTTGCGDVYHGAFLYGLVSGFGLEETMEIASAAAALKATKLGGRGLIADLARLREFMAATPLRG
jgi:sugar/nucleoside kinase (ribokinase family)